MAEKTTSMMRFFNSSFNKLDELSYLIEKDSYNAQLYAERAYLYYKQNDFDLASKDCQQAIVLEPTNQKYKKLWNDITLKSINHYGNMETYKMQIENLIY